MSHLSRHAQRVTLPRINIYNVRTYSDAAPTQSKAHDPLRLLFCGSDVFSIHCLRALHLLQKSNPEKVKTIEVLCRPDKSVGHGLKQIQAGRSTGLLDHKDELTLPAVPIKSVAQQLGLHIHQVDCFKQWTPPSPFPNLVVTASFGLLVPSSILSRATYGGLNVHPSLLPNLRGAAPIHHALLKQVKTTGVSVQTMHPTKFDHGVVLARREVDTFKLHEEEERTPTDVQGLTDRLALLGAEMLVECLQKGLFVRPVVNLIDRFDETGPLHKAPKLTPNDRMIDWEQWTADEIVLKDRILGRLWDTSSVQRCTPDRGNAGKRITFSGPWTIRTHGVPASSCAAGHPAIVIDRKVDGEKVTATMAFRTKDGAWVSPHAATIEGGGRDKGLQSLSERLKTKRHP